MSAVVASGLIGLTFLVVAGLYAAAALRKIYDAARDEARRSCKAIPRIEAAPRQRADHPRTSNIHLEGLLLPIMCKKHVRT
jgi:hypothetical protein